MKSLLDNPINNKTVLLRRGNLSIGDAQGPDLDEFGSFDGPPVGEVIDSKYSRNPNRIDPVYKTIDLTQDPVYVTIDLTQDIGLVTLFRELRENILSCQRMVIDVLEDKLKKNSHNRDRFKELKVAIFNCSQKINKKDSSFEINIKKLEEIFGAVATFDDLFRWHPSVLHSMANRLGSLESKLLNRESELNCNIQEFTVSDHKLNAWSSFLNKCRVRIGKLLGKAEE